MDSLESMKVGDKGLVCSGGWGRSMRLVTVEKVGKIHVTAGGTKYHIRNGRRASSSSWSSEWLEVFDQAKWDEFRREVNLQRLRNRLSGFAWRDCPEELAQNVDSLLAEWEEKSKKQETGA